MRLDTLEAAQRIREHQGNHESEISCGGEADLHRHFRRCKKNPGHRNFIPVQDFGTEHLPSGYHDSDIVDWIKAEADLTCRLSLRHISESRPKFYPNRQPSTHYPFYQDRGSDWLRTGTGWVSRMNKYTEKDRICCECEECFGQDKHTRKTSWVKVYVTSSAHVVYDDKEARYTTCTFHFDNSRTHISRCLSLTGFKIAYIDVEGDWCVMTHATHDTDLVNELYFTWNCWLELFKIVWSKYHRHFFNKGPTTGPSTCIIISHPHGCSKQISVGEWTDRLVLESVKDKLDDGREYFLLATEYMYNTPTCRGSSGAPVIILPPCSLWLYMFHHPHSEGRPGNYNNSGVWGEICFHSDKVHLSLAKTAPAIHKWVQVFAVSVNTSIFLISRKYYFEQVLPFCPSFQSFNRPILRLLGAIEHTILYSWWSSTQHSVPLYIRLTPTKAERVNPHNTYRLQSKAPNNSVQFFLCPIPVML